MGHGSVELRLYASLRMGKPNPVVSHELTGAKTVRELMSETGIPEEDVAIIMINGKRGQLETALSDRDTVSLFPLIGGG